MFIFAGTGLLWYGAYSFAHFNPNIVFMHHFMCNPKITPKVKVSSQTCALKTLSKVNA